MVYKNRIRIFNSFILQIILIAWSLLQLIPLVWVFISSFKPSYEITSHMLSLPRSFYIDNYNFNKFNLDTGANINIGAYVKNSIIVAISTLAILMVICFLAGFAIAKIKFPGKNVVLFILILFLGIPIYAILVPLYYLIASMGLTNNYLGIILPYVGLWCPFTILLLQTYFRQFPDELMDAAKIDGCNLINTFFRVVLPTSAGAVSMVIVINFIALWNEFILALTILTDNRVKTLSVGLLSFKGQYVTEWGPLFAGLVVALAPTILIYLIFHRNLIKGLQEGAIKG